MKYQLKEFMTKSSNTLYYLNDSTPLLRRLFYNSEHLLKTALA